MKYSLIRLRITLLSDCYAIINEILKSLLIRIYMAYIFGS